MFNPPWFQNLIWLDFRLALVLTIAMPLVLLIWAFVKKVPVAITLMTIYWRVASLLAITVYLMIGGAQLSFFAGFAARILIPLSLWFWIDVNEEITDLPPKPIKLILTAWRWAITGYSIIGAVCFLPFMQCGFSGSLLKSDYCRAWFQPPLAYKNIFHGGIDVGTLGALGLAALAFYTACLGYFLVVRLGKEGRIALEQPN